jgi:GH15 family glucan-1,4-alpha-glucosidase
MPHVLREYALLADGERGVLVGPRGDFAWMCFPQWHSDACFASLIGGRGVYAVTPRERFVWGGFYEDGLIWHSRWITAGGVVECEEALAVPGDPRRAVLLRRIVALRGDAELDVVLEPRGDYGRVGARRLHRSDDGVWTAELPEAHLTWTGAADAQVRFAGGRDRRLAVTLQVREGQAHDLALVLDRDAGGEATPDPDILWSATRAAWAQRLPDLSDSAAPRDSRHAYAVLQGLTCRAGGMVAAATMSLPERSREGRNYDYRYVWIRDQCFAGQAVAAAGPLPLLDSAAGLVAERLLADGPQLRPAYAVDGGTVSDEHALGLPGYPGGGDVAGNWVNRQFQLDAFGEALLLFAAAGDHDRLNADHWRAVEIAAQTIEDRWSEPGSDAGLWELEPNAWTHSRLICAAGLRRISAHRAPAAPARWLALADAIVADTAARALSPEGRWQRSPTDVRIDASLLLPALRGGIAADDPRTIATLHAVQDELTDDGYCYRYRPDDRPLGEAEGAFLMCGFAMALAHAQQGDATRAAVWFERNRTACGSPGLLTEEYDVRQRQLRGNMPKAFVHAMLLECAVTLDAGATT